MTAALIEEARRLSGAATAGPWTVYLGHWIGRGEKWSGMSAWKHETDRGEFDARFIAFARTAVPALCDALEAANAEVKRCRGLIDRDRTGLACALVGVRKLVAGWRWLAAGEWGSYSYEEHTQETLRREIGECLSGVDALAERALAESGYRADSAFHPGHPDRARELDELRQERDAAKAEVERFGSALVKIDRHAITVHDACKIARDALAESEALSEEEPKR